MNDALREIASAAVKLAAERDRLTKSLDSLRFAVETLEPSASLDDNGNLQTGLVSVKQMDEEVQAIKARPVAPEPTPPQEAAEQYPPDTPEQAEKAREEGQTVAMEPAPEPTQADRQARAAGLTETPRAAANLARSPKPRSQMKGQQREREERMDMIVQYTLDQPGHKSNPVDAAIALRFTRESVGRDYRELEQRGVFRRVGLAHSQYALENLTPAKRGRPTVEYVFVNGHAEAVEEKKPPQKKITEEQVRDAATKLDEFNMFELMHELGAEEYNRSFIVRALDHFVNRGWFRRTLKGWKHVKPVDPGAAAKYDAEHAPRGSGTRQDISGPVAGTGKPKKSGHPGVNEILAAARRQWGADSVEQSGDQHWKIRLPKGSDRPFLRLANTPGSAKSHLEDRSKFRKAGLKF